MLQDVISQNIRKGRLEAGLTQQDLAEAMESRGFAWRRETVAQSEGDGRTVSISELLGLCQIFEKPLEELLVPTRLDEQTRQVSKVQVSSAMTLTPREVRGLVRRGGVGQQSAKDRQALKLRSQIKATESRIKRFDMRVSELLGQRKSLEEHLKDLRGQLKSLGIEDSPC